ncbi:MAG TPA: hypothetical protein VM597_01015 [Gemmataceae bacterium]|jgi:hypothetical protein|nr:hypothetical protein [Gemmataceae bacterium]
MKLFFFLAGLLAGGGIGLMAGAETVQVSADGGRTYPALVSILSTGIGVGLAARVWRRSAA